MHPTILPLSPPPPRTLWTGFAARSVHAKPCFDCFLLFQRGQGTLGPSPFGLWPHKSLKALDLFERAALCYEPKDACMGRFSLRSLSFGSTSACGAIAQRATAQRPQTGTSKSSRALTQAKLAAKRIPDERTMCQRESTHQGLRAPLSQLSPRGRGGLDPCTQLGALHLPTLPLPAKALSYTL
jgi:hypothetical protein